MNKPHIWLRAETKPLERRAPLTPAGARELLDEGFRLTVEHDADRIFPSDDYRALNCDIAKAGAWVEAPADAIVLGLKELPIDSFPLVHRHIHFAHVYKDQAGAEDMLGRFVKGGGTLYDLEYLTLENGRRIAAFGYWAGFCGAALGVLAWANKTAGDARPLGKLASLPAKERLLEEVSGAIATVDRKPAVIVIGAKGRSGTGAVDLAKAAGLETVEWDLEETRGGGPFNEINRADVFVNCVLVGSPLPPFVTLESLSSDARRLSVIADVSCDPYGSYNPIPIYDRCTTFTDPCLEIIGGDKPLHLIAIDHLPSLLPKESSEDYVEQLLPYLKTLDDLESGVWERAKSVFVEKTRGLRQ
ncbi:MAG: saccharopine dehydrogenase [Woeseiaceae bacterium]|nr:saccharopine dehydrogenase [Woeseiaceae bacterium]